MSNISVTEELLDSLERRTAHLLAGLSVPDDGTIYKANFDGSTTVSRKPPELPSGRELLAYLLREGRSVRERPVVIAKEAAICELLLGQPAKGEGNN
jgi:hypothetical protein